MKNSVLNFLIATIAYLVIFLTIYLIHINFFRVDVILYAAIFDSILSILLFSVFFFLFKLSKNFNKFEILQIYVIFLLIGYSVSVSFPAILDRSFSLYILEKINAQNGSVKSSSMRDIFVNDYIDEYKPIEIRITEQVASGTIEVIDGCINLTTKGKFIANSSSYFRKNFLAKKRLVLNEYSDVLTDPLKYSTLNDEYSCEFFDQQ